MKIKRIVNGTEMEFELTYHEMWDAYMEEQYNCCREDVLMAFEDMTDDDLMETYGATMEEIKPLVDAMAHRYRKYMDNDDSWSYNREEAIRYILETCKEEKQYV